MISEGLLWVCVCVCVRSCMQAGKSCRLWIVVSFWCPSLPSLSAAQRRARSPRDERDVLMYSKPPVGHGAGEGDKASIVVASVWHTKEMKCSSWRHDGVPYCWLIVMCDTPREISSTSSDLMAPNARCVKRHCLLNDLNRSLLSVCYLWSL